MKRVARNEILSASEYEDKRNQLRSEVLKIKAARRIHLGRYLTFLFENHATILYQIQEMLRAERITGDREIQHEIDTYNELLGEKGELHCTLLIEVEDKAFRDQLLQKWLDLPKFIYIKTQQGQTITAEYDERQVGVDRLSSVQYLGFKIGDQIPIGIGCIHPDMKTEISLTPQQTSTLCEDLIS